MNTKVVLLSLVALATAGVSCRESQDPPRQVVPAEVGVALASVQDPAPVAKSSEPSEATPVVAAPPLTTRPAEPPAEDGGRTADRPSGVQTPPPDVLKRVLDQNDAIIHLVPAYGGRPRAGDGYKEGK